ncbi:MAG: hypothetical protein WCA11_03095, partial [Terracidiphilus sp.]
ITPVNGFSGSVVLYCDVEPTFYDTGNILPTCTVPSSIQLSSGSAATVDVDLSSDAQTSKGFYLMTVTAVAPNSSELGFDTSIDLMLSAAQSFSVSNSGAMQVNAGATSGNTTTISLTPSGGFTGTVNLTCAVTTNMASVNDTPGCFLSPATPNVTGTAAVTSTLTVSTTAATSGALAPEPGYLRIGGQTTGLAVVFFFVIPSKRRKWMRIVGAIVLAVSIGASGCGGGGGTGSGGGGGGGNSGTTPGAYSVTVTGTDAATGKITAQTTVALTVN